MLAVQFDLPAVARFLLQHGANNRVCGSFGEPLLLTVVTTGKSWATTVRLEKVGNLEERNAQGGTALYVGVQEA